MCSTHLLWRKKGNDPLFEHLKVSEFKADVREYIEHLYDNLAERKLIDRNFLNDIGNRLTQSWWELFVGNYLCSNELQKIAVHSRGPDFSFGLPKTKFWVECVAPWPNNPDQSIKGKRLARQLLNLNPDNFTSMVTNAVRTKNAKLFCDVRKNIISKSDGIVLAVSLGTAKDVDIADYHDTPTLFRALLGLGSQAWRITIDGDGNNSSEVVQTYTSAINSRNGTPISTNRFLTSHYSRISAVLYSIHRYVDRPDFKNHKMILLHNPMAANPLPTAYLNGVEEFIVKDNHLMKMQPEREEF